jgi:hypothetical protein
LSFFLFRSWSSCHFEKHFFRPMFACHWFWKNATGLNLVEEILITGVTLSTDKGVNTKWLQSDHKVTTKWPQSDYKVTTKVTSKWLQKYRWEGEHSVNRWL